MVDRISPVWWPVIGLTAPVLAPMLLARNSRFQKDVARAGQVNAERVASAEPMELPELESFELTVLVEEKAADGFLGAPGVCYWIRTDRGALLFDVGFGPETPVLARNAARAGFRLDRVDAVAISHLHPDHMGGFDAAREKRVLVPKEWSVPEGMPCYLPAEALADGFRPILVDRPRMLAAGIASTGPLARSLFLMGWTEEQAIVARVKGQGLVVVTGCGHPTIETILCMAHRMSGEPVYAIGGGLHFPITDSRLKKAGIQLQMIYGTGKPPWERITETDLNRTLEHLRRAAPRRLLLSAHDTCDVALGRFEKELEADTVVLRAGETYRLC